MRPWFYKQFVENERACMRKMILKNRIKDPYVILSVLTGIILLILTLLFRVNPVEGSVVNESIRGTPFHMFLFFTTMPAYMAGLFAGAGTFLTFPLMFLFQIILFALLGSLFRLIHNAVVRIFRSPS